MFYRSESGDIFFEAQGPAGAPTLMFTHGAGLNHAMFDAQLAALQSKYRIVVWDMPGHGRSARLEGHFPFVRMAHHLIGILDEMGVEKAVLVGQSLGSWVSQHAAVLYPARVAALVSLAGTPLEKGTGRLENAALQVSLLISKLLPGRMLFRWTAEQKAVTPEAKRFAEEAMQQIGKQQFLLIVAGMLEAGRLGITDAPRQPLLITHGEYEWPKSVATRCAAWHASVPGSRYVVIPAAGHNANQDNPEAFNQVLADFMARIGAETPDDRLSVVP